MRVTDKFLEKHKASIRGMDLPPFFANRTLQLEAAVDAVFEAVGVNSGALTDFPMAAAVSALRKTLAVPVVTSKSELRRLKVQTKKCLIPASLVTSILRRQRQNALAIRAGERFKADQEVKALSGTKPEEGE